MKPTDPPPHNRSHTRHDDGPRQGDHAELHNDAVDHEHSDVNVRAIGTSAGIIAGVVAVSMVAMYLLFGFFERAALGREPELSPLARPAVQMPATTTESPIFNESVDGVQLLTNEWMALERHRADERQRLHGYGWVDQGTGVAHIPIEEAKKLIIERGVPVREFDTVEPNFGTPQHVAGESSGGRSITEALPHPDEAADEAPAGDTGAPAAEKPQGQGGH
jgi:hypothetical protein